MTASLSAALRPAVESARERGRLPGLALAVARPDGPVERVFSGADAAGRPLGEETLFAVASITKLATALAVLRLVDTGALALDASLATLLPRAAAARPGVTLRTLLSHTSGLPMDVPEQLVQYGPGLSWPSLAAACLAVPLEAPPRTRVQYSNAGYGLLAIVVEQQTGLPFPEALRTLVLEPLGLEAYLGCEPPRQPAVLADVRGPQAGTAREPFNSPFWRRLGLPWGGLVTTLDGALALVRAFQGHPAGVLSAATVAEATRSQTGDLGGGQVPPLIWPRCPWGLGPELRDAKLPHWAPETASPDSFGHAGASGCLVWADPSAGIAWALIGTRTAASGWLLRQGREIGAAVLAWARQR